MALSRGDHLGPYEILGLLGAGGMGEVYRARDPRLDRDVAIKVLPEDLAGDADRLRRFEKEAKAAGALNHPNILAVHDVGAHDDRPYLVTELLEGETLRERLSAASLSAEKAIEHAVQIARGLAAAHDKGIVHRDLKPENLFVTNDGLLKILDFGLAKLRGPQGQPHRSGDDVETASRTTDPGAVIGTAGYMSPEQVRGRVVDHRSDFFSFGAVLYEMLSGRRAFRGESGVEVLNAILKEEPPDIGPVESGLPPQLTRVLRRCLEKRPEERFQSARDLAFGLEAVATDELQRVRTLPKPDVPEERPPYPGLAAFTEGDAEHFFGREAEAEALSAKLRRLKLLGLIGPSGAGKTSFLRAGLLPSRPEGWGAVVCQPGDAPLVALSRALVPELSGDTDAMRELVHLEDPEVALSVLGRWRKRHGQAVLIVDQFEELFTLNPPEVQASFAGLLGRLASESDVHVLLSMRDDFLFRCHDHDALAPVFAELTPLGPPTGAALRRALVEPALKHGFQFEDDALVEEMLSEVTETRGALPLLAFAVSRLWEQRDRDRKLLTREAYSEIGGVGGALAQHAEATMDQIGPERQALVREIFRNLVTAQGTRAVMDREELLSAFSERRVAEKVLDQLIDARLLTSYEAQGREDEPSHHRIEVVHESLLTAWPRLVRWQTQDQDSALLRDQLKQAAHLWEEKGRTPELLWSGTAFREYELWRERYSGKLTALEDGFAKAMVDRARRRKRIRRWALATLIVVLAGVATIVGVSHQRAVQGVLRAEASELVTLGRVALEADRTEALAYAIASLGRTDTAKGRRLALRALWAGPPAIVMPELPAAGSGPVDPMGLAVSPDGRHIAAGYTGGVVRVFPRDGGAPVTLHGFEDGQGPVWDLAFSSDGALLAGGAVKAGGEVRVWETDGWQLLRVLESPEPPELLATPDGASIAYGLFESGPSSVLTVTFRPEGGEDLSRGVLGHWVLRRWPLDGGAAQLVGEVAGTMRPPASPDVSRGLLAAGIGGELHLHRLDTLGREPPRIVGRHAVGFTRLSRVAFDPTGERLAACDYGGTLRVWPLGEDGTRPERELETPGMPAGTAFSPGGSRLALASLRSAGWLWDLRGPAGAEPLRFGAEGTVTFKVAFTPDGHWLATSARDNRLALWPLSDRYPRVLRSAEGAIRSPVFHPDGSRILAKIAEKDGSESLLSWPLTGGAGLEPTVLFRGSYLWSCAVDPKGRFVILGSMSGVRRIPLDGGAPTLLEGVGRSSRLELDPTGRYLASQVDLEPAPAVAVLDLQTGERLELEGLGDGPVDWYSFDPAGRLLVTRGGVLSRWDPKARTTEVLLGEGVRFASALGDGRLSIVREDTWFILDLESGTRAVAPQAHQPPDDISFDGSGSIVASGHQGGEVRVGPLLDEKPHLLLGPGVGFVYVFVSPDGKWVASQSEDDDVLRLWPMPDLSRPPLHTLPYDQLMPQLKALTNLRAVPDEGSATGYTVEPDFTAYRGWTHVPTW